jgi:Fur family ferric uptake transcriptional regulator
MSTDVESTLSILQESGYRVTAPRRAVVETVHSISGAFSADELTQRIQTAGANVGRATVFRTLDMLVQQHVLDRLHRPDGCHSYVRCQPSEAHHHHLICSDCGAVVQFEDCTVAPLLEELSRRTDFQISGHWLEVFGTCASCRHASTL